MAREKELAVEVDSLLKRSEDTSLRLDDVKQQLSATREEVTRREKEEGKGGGREGKGREGGSWCCLTHLKDGY